MQTDSFKTHRHLLKRNKITGNDVIGENRELSKPEADEEDNDENDEKPIKEALVEHGIRKDKYLPEY